MNLKLKKIILTTLCVATLGFGLSGAVNAEEMTTAATAPSVSYNTHVQNIGWQNYVNMGELSGTSGKGYRLEGTHIKLDAGSYDLGIQYDIGTFRLSCPSSCDTLKKTGGEIRNGKTSPG